MIRFILERKQKLECGAETERWYRIDGSIQLLEDALRSGGYGENTYDVSKLVGVELIDEQDEQDEPSREEIT